MLRFTAVPPRVPALMGRVRLALKSDLAVDSNETVESPGSIRQRQAKAAATPTALPSSPLLEALAPYKSLKRQSKVEGCLELVDVRDMMSIYRKFRDSSQEPVPASDVVHAILSTLRVRMSVLKPLISVKKYDAVNTQNPELKQYLEEIVEDVLAGKAYLSTFALTYLLTAFGTLNCFAEATKVWRKLSEQQTLPMDLAERIRDPKVVGSFIRYADPNTVTLEEIEKTYEDTVISRGHHILLDEALAISYLRYGEMVRAAELYAHMCRTYPSAQWQDTLSRLHNSILTESKDAELSAAFFVSAVSPESHIKLHPSSATKYLEYVANSQGDASQIVDIYRQAVERFASRINYVQPLQYQNLTSSAVRCLLAVLQVDSAEARAHLGRLLPLDTSPVIALNTLLSFLSKSWPTSTYLEDIMAAVAARGPLRVDTIRVFLNASQFLDSASLSSVQDLWNQRKKHETPIDRFDLLALLHACNHPERASLFVSEYKAALEQGAVVAAFIEKRLSNFQHVAPLLSSSK